MFGDDNGIGVGIDDGSIADDEEAVNDNASKKSVLSVGRTPDRETESPPYPVQHRRNNGLTFPKLKPYEVQYFWLYSIIVSWRY